jgi:hypothetical protein
MNEKLKNIKSDIQETTFKDFKFDSVSRHAVFRKIRNNQDEMKDISLKQRIHNRFRGVLTILAYSGLLILTSSILVNYLSEPQKTNHGQEEVVVKEPVGNPKDGMILTNNEYENNTYSFKLAIPDDWVDVVWIQELEYGIRFFYKGEDDSQQDLFTISVEKVTERLKFLYEGGPDPSTDIAILEDSIYRYIRTLDIALTSEIDIAEYGKLKEEVPNVIQSFTFINNKSGLIGDTPYIYGLTVQHNQQYGFDVNTPNNWQNLFKVEESDKEMKFLFQKEESVPTEFLSFMFLTVEEWNEIKTRNSEDKHYTEITEKDGIIFVASTATKNPFEDGELFYPYEMLRNEAKFVIESFQFLD